MDEQQNGTETTTTTETVDAPKGKKTRKKAARRAKPKPATRKKTNAKKTTKKTTKKTKAKKKGHPGDQVCISMAPPIYDAFESARRVGKRNEVSRSFALAKHLLPWLRKECSARSYRKAEEWVEAREAKFGG